MAEVTGPLGSGSSPSAAPVVPVLRGLTGDFAWGLDVSSHQAPASIDWKRAAALGCSYGIVRILNGLDRDVAAPEHVKRIRDAGIALGGYGFFVPWHDPNTLADAFADAAEALGYGRAGDVPPWLDVETWRSNSGILRKAEPSWSPLARATLAGYARHFGAATLYVNADDWNSIGRPEWIGEHAIAAAHYTNSARPMVAGDAAWSFWQRTVDPIQGVSDRPIDQSVAARPLALLADEATAEPIDRRVNVGWIPVAWDRAEHNRLRNLAAERII